MTIERPCPECGHDDDDHRRESWYDEEGIEGMTCEVCEDAGNQCQWWTHDWDEVLSEAAINESRFRSPAE